MHHRIPGMADRILGAIDPAADAVVHAAAGTGKTWLLTSRIVRLLLAGAEPGAMLAITFTRKAAQEMTDRVHRRLREMAAAPDAQLSRMLSEIGVTGTDDDHDRARTLFERVLTSPHPLRTTTFHAFCQELLQRFAFEAAIAPGFELMEDSADLRREAWQRLTRELTQAPSGAVAESMDLLLDHLGSLASVRAALRSFLLHASDWWAYTEGADEPVSAAITRLEQIYGPIDNNPRATLLGRADFRAWCRNLVDSVDPTVDKSLTARSHAAEQALSATVNFDVTFAMLEQAFFTKAGHGRQLKAKQAERTVGDGQTLAEVHENICAAIEETRDTRKAAAAFALTSAWYHCGARFLAHYQQLKYERNQLDFADLEWQTYRLLTTGDHAQWVQYKLDQRIDHLLIDEFQDTNPTQWRLVLPLLQELAAGDPERRRSVFLVGDEKQSVYRFRRAEPRLFRAAHDWLLDHTGASAHTQDASWRSSPAIIDFVNMVFDQQHDESARGAFSLPDFRAHTARYASRPGNVEIRPLIEHATDPIPASGPPSGFRNPLITPRESEEDRRYRDEAAWIAGRIQALRQGGIGIETDSEKGPAIRRIRYGDIFILLRNRTYARAYEDALREAGIPFLGVSRGQFQDALEIRDLLNLLRVLVSPHDDLALTGVLRSPLFAFSDGALIELAAIGATLPWWQRLADKAGQPPATEPFARAWRLLSGWHALADHVPVHDLLDRIFFDGDVTARYDSATPLQLRARVQANLTRFIALALEFDSGRYPSLSRFLRQFDTNRAGDGEPPPDAALASPEDCVRVLTIHAAKGLEAPVVFLADATRGGTLRTDVPWTLVDWPADAAGPTRMLLGGKLDRLDRITRAVYDAELAATRREEANLLYVGITRAKQLLFVSGCAPTWGDELGWYGFLQARLRHAHETGIGKHVRLTRQPIAADASDTALPAWTLTFGEMPTATATPAPVAEATNSDDRLYQPLSAEILPTRRRPSALSDDLPLPPGGTGHWRDARTRGIVIHRALDLATRVSERAQAHDRLLREYTHALPATWLDECWQEALAVIDAPALRELFDPSRYRDARNELPLLYRDDGDEVYGFIDRVVRTDSSATLIDYKTNRVRSAADIDALTAHYAPQLVLYARGLAKVWPQTPLRALLLFTNLQRAVEIPLSA